MDNQKDIQKVNLLSHILGRPIRTSPFGDNRAAERVYRRAERIAAASYLVTNHLPENEPARSALRSEANNLLTEILNIREGMRSPDAPQISRVLEKVRGMISMARLLASSGLMSLQNLDVLIEALDELGSFVVSSQKSSMAERVSLSRDELLDMSVSDTIKDKSMSYTRDTVKVRDVRTVSYKSGDRKKTAEVRVRNILEVVRSGGELGIKEIAANMPEIGEKTLQRELSDLVLKGQLRRIGLKRWSKYSLPA
ncbi:MAG TPA: hypothetical protein VHD38_00310 [Candidatus Paceibacterota bacterium]|nr:hypothetical protein [Candidatus Paceibacterota bacterium]